MRFFWNIQMEMNLELERDVCAEDTNWRVSIQIVVGMLRGNICNKKVNAQQITSCRYTNHQMVGEENGAPNELVR